jgi:hypothetical protein
MTTPKVSVTLLYIQVHTTKSVTIKYSSLYDNVSPCVQVIAREEVCSARIFHHYCQDYLPEFLYLSG